MNWIGRFENKHPAEVVCPGFYRLRYLAACSHGCPYCFLQSNRFGWPKDITEADLPETERAVGRWLLYQRCTACSRYGVPNGSGICPRCSKWTEPEASLLNAGELGDSFAPEISLKASLRLIELFRRQERHTLLLVSKAAPEELLEVELTKQVILSWSLGQPALWEADYLRANKWISPIWPHAYYLREIVDLGWRVRLRIDPMISDSDIAKDIRRLLPSRRVERVTLGSLRATPGLYRHLRNGTVAQRALAALLTKQPDSGSHPYRLPFQQRVDLYGKAMEQLKGLAAEIGLCKETPEVFAALGLEPESNCCNCIL